MWLHRPFFMMIADGVFTGICQNIVYFCADSPMGGEMVFSTCAKVCRPFVHGYFPWFVIYRAVIFIYLISGSGSKIQAELLFQPMQGELWSEIMCLNLVCAVWHIACISVALIKYSETGSYSRLVSYQISVTS